MAGPSSSVPRGTFVLYTSENPEVVYACYMQPIPLASLQEAADKENTDPNFKTEAGAQFPTLEPSLLPGASANKVEAILGQVHKDFRKFLHLSEILPSLNARSLLTPDEMETLQGLSSTNQQKVDKLLLEILPRKGMNVLKQLIDSLHESKSGTGSAHIELAEKLEGLTGILCTRSPPVKGERKASAAGESNLTAGTVERDLVSNEKDKPDADEPMTLPTCTSKPLELTRYGTLDIRSYFRPEPANL